MHTKNLLFIILSSTLMHINAAQYPGNKKNTQQRPPRKNMYNALAIQYQTKAQQNPTLQNLHDLKQISDNLYNESDNQNTKKMWHQRSNLIDRRIKLCNNVPIEKNNADQNARINALTDLRNTYKNTNSNGYKYFTKLLTVPLLEQLQQDFDAENVPSAQLKDQINELINNPLSDEQQNQLNQYNQVIDLRIAYKKQLDKIKKSIDENTCRKKLSLYHQLRATYKKNHAKTISFVLNERIKSTQNDLNTYLLNKNLTDVTIENESMKNFATIISTLINISNNPKHYPTPAIQSLCKEILNTAVVQKNNTNFLNQEEFQKLINTLFIAQLMTIHDKETHNTLIEITDNCTIQHELLVALNKEYQTTNLWDNNLTANIIEKITTLIPYQTATTKNQLYSTLNHISTMKKDFNCHQKQIQNRTINDETMLRDISRGALNLGAKHSLNKITRNAILNEMLKLYQQKNELKKSCEIRNTQLSKSNSLIITNNNLVIEDYTG